jgi:hypothetical protein
MTIKMPKALDLFRAYLLTLLIAIPPVNGLRLFGFKVFI